MSKYENDKRLPSDRAVKYSTSYNGLVNAVVKALTEEFESYPFVHIHCERDSLNPNMCIIRPVVDVGDGVMDTFNYSIAPFDIELLRKDTQSVLADFYINRLSGMIKTVLNRHNLLKNKE